MATTTFDATFFSTNPSMGGLPGLGGGFNEFAYGRIPTLGNNMSVELFNTSASHDVYRFNAHSWIEFYFGIAGPSWVTAFNVEGQYDDTSMSLTFRDTDYRGDNYLNSASYTAAGLTIGCGVLFNLRLTLNAIIAWRSSTTCSDAWHCHTNWYPVWAQLVNTTVGITLDLIAIILQLVKQLAGGGAESGSAGASALNFVTSGLGKGFDMYASTFNFHETGKASLNPRWSKIFDISSEIPPLNGFKQFLARFGGGIVVGPAIGFEQTVDVSLFEVNAPGLAYGELTFNGGSQSSATMTGARVGTASIGAGQLEFVYSTETTFDLTVGFGATITLAKLFSVGDQASIGVLGLLGLAPNTGEVEQILVSDLVNVSSAAPARVVLDPGGTGDR